MGHCNGLNIVGHLFYSGLNTIKILLDKKTIINLSRPKNHIISYWAIFKWAGTSNVVMLSTLPRQTTM
jgi:hypothetical protein